MAGEAFLVCIKMQIISFVTINNHHNLFPSCCQSTLIQCYCLGPFPMKTLILGMVSDISIFDVVMDTILCSEVSISFSVRG